MTSPDAGGRRFPLGNGTYTLFEVAQMLRGGLPERSRKLPHFEMPDWLVRVYALFDRDVQANLGDLGIVRRADASDAKALLGRPFIAAQDTVVDTGKSIVEQHLS
jgi:dihydroflavonol-4-reductase